MNPLRIPSYWETNESLDAIVNGMNVGKRDRILAVLGSGDQAFALLEKAAYVKAVDNCMAQVEHAQARIKYPETTLTKPHCSHFYGNRDYFSAERIAEIKKKASCLEIAEEDIFTEGNIEEFNKIYLSNASTNGSNPLDKVNGFLNRLAQNLGKPGIVYFTADPEFKPEIIIPKRFSLDKELTRIARKHERNGIMVWRPAIYRRKA